ncbi:TRAP transporter small permease [Niallia endozanthoxylica]|uniref:TRAP transporter small permease n=1 Tax=Niallia endozanthoxylica TaxID=2036016 RepID=A0A5J5HTJ2_9BACI|nr:TRAP transporter small permease [Niallia endozanthoxylica]KAA9023656.1 TRAP transporter small permease [Niallia endozanthoxylica]
MKLLNRISFILDVITRSFISLSLIVMTVALFAQFIARYVFQSGVVWTDELSRFLMIALIFLGAAIATRDRSHITVSIFEDLWPAAAKWLRPIQDIVMFAYSVIVLIYGLDALEVVQAQISPNLRISMGIIYSVFPITAILMMVHIVAKIRKKEAGSKQNDNEIEEIEHKGVGI